MELEYLKEYKQIYIIGHDNPDADSIISSKILADIFKAYGINADYAILEDNLPLKVDNILIKDCLEYHPHIIKHKDISLYKYFLVDHNDPIQSIQNVDLVVGVIDHHPNSKALKNVIITAHCSTSLAIYDLFKNNYLFNDLQKKQIFYALLSDSCFGRNSRYQELDKQLVIELGYNPNLEEYFKKYFIPTNLDNIDYAFKNSNLKSYNFNGIQFESTYIQSFDIDKLIEFKKFIQDKNHHLGMWLDYINNKTYVFFQYDDLYLEKEYDYLVSRTKIISNEVLEFLRSNDKDV